MTDAVDESFDNEFQVHLAVHMLTGKTVLEETGFPATGTFKDVKQVVQTATGFPARQQRLVWQDAVVEDASALGDMLPSRGALLHLIHVPVPEAVAKAEAALEAAIGDLDCLNKRSFAEVKAYAKPPDMVMKTMCAVMTVMEKTPSWAQSKTELSDLQFLQRVKMLDARNINDATLRKIKKYTRDPNFTPNLVGNVSSAAGALCQWVHAVLVCAELHRGAVQS
jgi:hypothetical protein